MSFWFKFCYQVLVWPCLSHLLLLERYKFLMFIMRELHKENKKRYFLLLDVARIYYEGDVSSPPPHESWFLFRRGTQGQPYAFFSLCGGGGVTSILWVREEKLGVYSTTQFSLFPIISELPTRSTYSVLPFSDIGLLHGEACSTKLCWIEICYFWDSVLRNLITASSIIKGLFWPPNGVFLCLNIFHQF